MGKPPSSFLGVTFICRGRSQLLSVYIYSTYVCRGLAKSSHLPSCGTLSPAGGPRRWAAQHASVVFHVAVSSLSTHNVSRRDNTQPRIQWDQVRSCPVVAFFLNLGASEDEVWGLVSEYPSLLDMSLQHVVMPLSNHLLQRGFKTGILDALRQRSLKYVNQLERLDYLHQTGLLADDISSVLTKFPKFVALDTDLDIVPVVNQLRADHIRPHHLVAILSRYPEVFQKNQARKVASVMSFLSSEVLLSSDDVSRVLGMFPRLIAYSVSRNLRPKLHLLRSHLRRPSPADDILAFPTFFGFSEHRIRARYKYACYMGRRDLSLASLLACADVVFAERIGGSLTEYLNITHPDRFEKSVQTLHHPPRLEQHHQDNQNQEQDQGQDQEDLLTWGQNTFYRYNVDVLHDDAVFDEYGVVRNQYQHQDHEQAQGYPVMDGDPAVATATTPTSTHLPTRPMPPPELDWSLRRARVFPLPLPSDVLPIRSGRAARRSRSSDSRSTLDAKTDFLRELGATDDDINKMWVSYPSFFNRSVDQRVRPAVEYFRSLGVDDHDIVRMLRRRPQCFCADLDNKIKPIVRFLQDEAGLEGEGLRRMLVIGTGVFTHSLDLNLRPKLAFLQHHMGVCPDDLAHYPTLLCCSLEHRLRPRLAFLRLRKQEIAPHPRFARMDNPTTSTQDAIGSFPTPPTTTTTRNPPSSNLTNPSTSSSTTTSTSSGNNLPSASLPANSDTGHRRGSTPGPRKGYGVGVVSRGVGPLSRWLKNDAAWAEEVAGASPREYAAFRAAYCRPLGGSSGRGGVDDDEDGQEEVSRMPYTYGRHPLLKRSQHGEHDPDQV